MLNKILKPLVEVEKKLGKYFEQLKKEQSQNIKARETITNTIVDNKLVQEKTEQLIKNFSKLLNTEVK